MRSILETFLSGMETRVSGNIPEAAMRSPLETFLSGMETVLKAPFVLPEVTLKPSLVEWKHSPQRAHRHAAYCP